MEYLSSPLVARQDDALRETLCSATYCGVAVGWAVVLTLVGAAVTLEVDSTAVRKAIPSIISAIVMPVTPMNRSGLRISDSGLVAVAGTADITDTE